MAVLLAFSVFPFSTAYAVEGTETVDTRQTEEFALPNIVTEEEAVGRGYIGRVKEEEKDNYTFVFKDSENMRTMRVYSHPVKYTDKDGNEYFFDGAGKLLVNGEPKYSYTVRSYNSDNTASIHVTDLATGKKYEAELDYSDNENVLFTLFDEVIE